MLEFIQPCQHSFGDAELIAIKLVKYADFAGEKS